MEFYVLDANFQPVEVLDTFVSAIWTERFSVPGDMSIAVQPTAAMRSLLTEGKRLSTPGSTEIMTIETALVEDGLLKISGKTLDEIFNDRFIYNSAYNIPKAWPIVGTPGSVIQQLIEKFILGTAGSYSSALSVSQAIPNFSLGSIDTSGTSGTISVPFGELGAALRQIAETNVLGISLYRESFTPPTTYSLKLKVWKGLDRTRNQSVNEVVQFSSNLDNLDDVKSLRSIAEYKNVAIMWAASIGEAQVGLGDGSTFSNPMAVYATVADETKTGFDRRIMYLEADDVVPAGFAWNTATDAQMIAIRTALKQRGADALANNKYIKMIDGEVILDGRWVYGTHYGLGDIVELVDEDVFTKARITEFIRSQDAEGEKAYPTVSVID